MPRRERHNGSEPPERHPRSYIDEWGRGCYPLQRLVTMLEKGKAPLKSLPWGGGSVYLFGCDRRQTFVPALNSEIGMAVKMLAGERWRQILNDERCQHNIQKHEPGMIKILQKKEPTVYFPHLPHDLSNWPPDAMTALFKMHEHTICEQWLNGFVLPTRVVSFRPPIDIIDRVAVPIDQRKDAACGGTIYSTDSRHMLEGERYLEGLPSQEKRVVCLPTASGYQGTIGHGESVPPTNRYLEVRPGSNKFLSICYGRGNYVFAVLQPRVNPLPCPVVTRKRDLLLKVQAELREFDSRVQDMWHQTGIIPDIKSPLNFAVTEEGEEGKVYLLDSTDLRSDPNHRARPPVFPTVTGRFDPEETLAWYREYVLRPFGVEPLRYRPRPVRGHK